MWHWMGGFFMILIMVMVVIGILSLWRGGHRGMHCGMHGHMHGDMHADRAPAILRERYARGEITKEQFEQMKSDLG
jgi:putative membrane protein